MAEKQFSGFPARAEVTPIPNLFFSAVMPEIDSIAELKVILHIFWLLSRRKGYPKFVTYNELLADSSLVSGLEEGAKPKSEVLRDALNQAVQRGIMLHLISDRDGKPEDVYFLNGEDTKAVISRIEQGKLPQLTLTPRAVKQR